PRVAQWNLARFAETVLPLLAATEELAVAVAVETLEGFMPRYHGLWSAGMVAKFGLAASVESAALVDRALALMTEHQVDYTSFFRRLAQAGRGDTAALPGVFGDWLARWRAMNPDVDAMDRVNPVYIPRNHLVEQALTAAMRGDLTPVDQLLGAITDPYRECDGLADYASPAPADFGVYRTFCGT
ncbi:protein adenylyltransferase SelO family protein, partial [Mycolicibacter arupensis]|uniref:protein adenylyltransferase SelO family protein n=1 Tax=Mycolicibacter arupensis TaxID=342002 RepID=UPI003B3ACA22